jgi:hypothetical protein
MKHAMIVLLTLLLFCVFAPVDGFRVQESRSLTGLRESRSLAGVQGFSKKKTCPKSALKGYCSGNGECNEEKNCVCNEGWGKADCSLNVNALRVVSFVTSNAKGTPLCDDLPAEVLEACLRATDEGECAPYKLSSANVCKSICPTITGRVTCDTASRSKICRDSEGIPCFGICDAMVEWYCKKHVKKEQKAKAARAEEKRKDPMGGGEPPSEDADGDESGGGG